MFSLGTLPTKFLPKTDFRCRASSICICALRLPYEPEAPDDEGFRLVVERVQMASRGFVLMMFLMHSIV